MVGFLNFLNCTQNVPGFGDIDSEYEMERGRESPDGGFSNASTYKSLLDSASKTFKGTDSYLVNFGILNSD